MPSIFDEFLELDPLGRQASFLGRLPSGLNTRQFEFGQSLFQPTFNRYLGQLGRQIQGGGTPTLTFNDFLQQSFNPQRELLRAPDDRSRLFGNRTIFDFGR